MKKGSIFVRFGDNEPILPKILDSKYLTESGEVQIDSEGNKKFVARKVVVDGLASDFDVISNSLRQGNMGVVRIRDTSDPVDLPTNYPDLFNNLNS